MPFDAVFDGGLREYGLVGQSAALQAVLRTIKKLHSNTSPVLISGESGVGKELVARALHRASPLSDKVFLPVDAASLVGSLMESELFGYKKGAFTGATEDKLGLVRAAEGGTLFLDEVGELPLEVQAKLLRLLQEGEMRPIGSVQPIPVAVRIVAATNRDLKGEVRHGGFRKDLFYRLNVIHLRVPPLRERRDDIPMLVEHFIQKYSVHPVVISDDVMQTFWEHDWPGNVRELENTVQRLVALKSNPVVQVDDLPSQLRNLARAAKGETLADGQTIEPLAEVERRHILRAVELTKGDMNAAAMMLGIGRTTLYRKVNQYRAEDRRERAEIT